MKLTEVISRKAILPEIKAKDKRSVVAEMAAAMKKAYADEKFTAPELVDAIMKREDVGSTGLHGGVAIPHAHLKGIREIRAAFGRSVHPVDFRAMDGGPTHLFFLIVAPPGKNEEYLALLQRLTKAIGGTHFLKFLRAAKTAKDIEDILRDVEEPART